MTANRLNFWQSLQLSMSISGAGMTGVPTPPKDEGRLIKTERISPDFPKRKWDVSSSKIEEELREPLPSVEAGYLENTMIVDGKSYSVSGSPFRIPLSPIEASLGFVQRTLYELADTNGNKRYLVANGPLGSLGSAYIPLCDNVMTALREQKERSDRHLLQHKDINLPIYLNSEQKNKKLNKELFEIIEKKYKKEK